MPSPVPSQRQAAQSQLNPADKQRLLNQLVHYILKADSKKSTIKRPEIVKNVLKDHSKLYDPLMSEAAKVLQDVFGISLTEVEGKKGQYILYNNLKISEEKSHVHQTVSEYEKQGLLTIILALIFMNDNVIAEEVVWRSLEELGVLNPDDSHQKDEGFGDVKRLVSVELVRQLYLDRVKVETSDPPTYEYRWGPRAKLEITKSDILAFVCKIYGDMRPEQWTSQYTQIMEEENRGEPAEVEDE